MLPMDVSIKDLCVATPAGRVLLKIPQLKIPAGESCLLRGKSGMGKSTLLQYIGALSPIRQGHIQVGTIALESLTAKTGTKFRRDHVSFLFQRLNLIEHLTVYENLSLAVPFPVERGEAEGLLQKLNLLDRMNHQVAGLSLGECQRIAMTRTLLSPAQIILADEPTSSLDAENTEAIFGILKDQKKRRTVICVSHDDRITQFFDHTYDLKAWVV
jgi:putative ABC transport system ATP-binding protein